MKRFSSINQFRNVHKAVHHYAQKKEIPPPTMLFRGTVKLHGTNAAVMRTISDSGERKFICQSRNNVVGDGHFGFPYHIKRIDEQVLSDLFDVIASDAHNVTIYGEWIGPGVQGGVAISGLPEKQWVVYAAAVDDDYVPWDPGLALHEHNIYNICEAGVFEVEVDFAKPERAMAEMERLTLEVEARCPWGKKFGIEGVGEGIVWAPVYRHHDSDLWFKTKGDKHSVTKVKRVVSVDPEAVESIRALVEVLMPDARMQQGIEYLGENGMEVDAKYTGQYLNYIGQELKREEEDTIIASGFEWKQVWSPACVKARNFFLAEAKKL